MPRRSFVPLLLAAAMGIAAQPAHAQDGTIIPRNGYDQSHQGHGHHGTGAGQTITTQGLGSLPGSQLGGSGGSFAGLGQTTQETNPILASLDITFLQGDRIVARVGPDVILLSQVIPELHLIRQQPEMMNEEAMEVVRGFIEGRLPEWIERKLVLQDFERNVPKDERPGIKKQFIDYFENTVLPSMMADQEIATRSEFVQTLRDQGMTLEQLRDLQVDRLFAQVWVGERSKAPKEFTREELLAYYNEHIADYEFQSQARWEQIMIAKSGNPAEAYKQLANLGNQMLQWNVPFAQVAKDHSDGPTATSGGIYDWTTQGSLISEPIDQALFQMPVGQLSRIIEDDRGFHIIRVIERKQAGVEPFEQVQDGIRETLMQEHLISKREEYMAILREKTPVWSILDGPPQTVGARNSASSQVGDGIRQPF